MRQRPRTGGGTKWPIPRCDLYTPTGPSPFTKCSLITLL